MPKRSLQDYDEIYDTFVDYLKNRLAGKTTAVELSGAEIANIHKVLQDAGMKAIPTMDLEKAQEAKAALPVKLPFDENGDPTEHAAIDDDDRDKILHMTPRTG